MRTSSAWWRRWSSLACSSGSTSTCRRPSRCPSHERGGRREPMTIERLTPGSGLQAFPPADKWDDWREYDTKAWPRKVEKRYLLVPTICFNCEAACGMLAFVDKDA